MVEVLLVVHDEAAIVDHVGHDRDDDDDGHVICFYDLCDLFVYLCFANDFFCDPPI